MRLQLTNEFRMSSSLDRQGAQVRDTGSAAPLVHLALAGFDEDPTHADFLRRYSLPWAERRPQSWRSRRLRRAVWLALAHPSACLQNSSTKWATLRDRSSRPFVINHTGRSFNPEAFAVMLAFKPAAISFHMGYRRI
jgi:hypothetical protein